MTPCLNFSTSKFSVSKGVQPFCTRTLQDRLPLPSTGPGSSRGGRPTSGGRARSRSPHREWNINLRRILASLTLRGLGPLFRGAGSFSRLHAYLVALSRTAATVEPPSRLRQDRRPHKWSQNVLSKLSIFSGAREDYEQWRDFFTNTFHLHCVLVAHKCMTLAKSLNPSDPDLKLIISQIRCSGSHYKWAIENLERIFGGKKRTSLYLLDNIRCTPVVKDNCRKSLTEFLGKLEAYQDSLHSDPEAFDSDSNLDLFCQLLEQSSLF